MIFFLRPQQAKRGCDAANPMKNGALQPQSSANDSFCVNQSSSPDAKQPNPNRIGGERTNQEGNGRAPQKKSENMERGVQKIPRRNRHAHRAPTESPQLPWPHTGRRDCQNQRTNNKTARKRDPALPKKYSAGSAKRSVRGSLAARQTRLRIHQPHA